MKIIVSDNWLNACGLNWLSGKALEVLNVKDFGSRGKFYQVKYPNKHGDFDYQWEIWDYRGITIIE